MKKGNKIKTIIAVVIIIASVFLGWESITAIFSGRSTDGRTTREVAMSCTLHLHTKFHIHQHLVILVNGLPQTIPANTGVTFACMNPLHTHDETGEIHVESPDQRDFTLGDFFAVWDKTFDRNQIFDYKADADHEIVMTVNDNVSQEYEKLVLKDKQQIVIEYKKL